MRFSVFLNDTETTDAIRASDLEITQNITDRVSQASLTFIAQGESGLAVFDEAVFDTAKYGVDVRELYEIRIENKETGARVFAGTVRQVKPVRQKADLVFLECECLDWTTVLDEAFIPLSLFNAGLTDRFIIQSLIQTFAPSISSLPENIQILVPVMPEWGVEEKTLREALDEIAEFSGAEWRIDYNKNFRYFLPHDYPASFGLSSQPNSVSSRLGLTWNSITGTWDTTVITWDATALSSGSSGSGGQLTWNADTRTWESAETTWDDPGEAPFPTYGIDAFTDYNRDAIRIINRCIVLGEVGPGGVRIKAQYDNEASQGVYGIRSSTVQDDNIKVAFLAGLRAKAIVDANAFPRETIRLKTIIDGLEAGKSLPIYHSDFFINGAYIIREMRIKPITRSITEYTITAGARETDTLRLLKQIDARSRRFTSPTHAVPATGSVTTASIGGTLSASVIGSVNAESIIGAISATQVGSVNAAVIAGLISAGQIGSINATAIQGAIISSQVADGLIDSLAKIAAPLRDIPELTTDPELPDPNFPSGSFYRRTGDNQFRKNSAGTWVNVTESEAVTGKLAFYSIGSIKAGSIIGLIAAAQIGSVNASSITGAILASQIGTVNASAIQGTLSGSQIGVINASSITGTFTASQISSVNASSIVGGITSSQITSVAASTLTGGITSSQITSVNAGSISGSISSTQIGSINAASITIGLVQNSQIGSVSASKLTAGTIVAGVSITSPIINGGSITGATITLNLNNTVTTLANTFDGSLSQYVGLSIFDSLNNRDTALWSTGLVMRTSGVANVNLGNVSGGEGFLTLHAAGGGGVSLLSATPRFVLSHPSGSQIAMGVGGGVPNLQFNGVQVVGARVAVRPTTLADVINLLVTHGLSA